MSRSKIFLYCILTLLIAFGIGYSRGVEPELWRQLLRTDKGHFVILLGGEDALPLETIQRFERSTGSTVEIRFAGQPHIFNQELAKADLLFAPMSWLGSIANQLTPFPDYQKLSKTIASDFLSLRLMPEMVLPILWKVTTPENSVTSHLQILGFATARDEGDFPKAALLLIQKLIKDPENLIAWGKAVPFSMTIEQTNSLKDFPDDKRANRIREINLTTLEIERKL
jgi:hypothetical protein